ncbi:hypothetical protein BJN34_28405 [Cupriavidus necator]|uniref:Uncharacterized protein n=1 Tax=Cupriavidus necator TaxID=106590 RepID=A0A1U9UYS6_CUPNE|nr:hypothetical protein [Cupriavidus necator]AQV97793.1 hypothetical protein BJN34_28405 [Cupriavidus necator]
MPRAQAVLQDVERRWNTAALTWNADALTALYAPAAVFFGGRPGRAVRQAAIGVVDAAPLVDRICGRQRTDAELSQMSCLTLRLDGRPGVLQLPQ